MTAAQLAEQFLEANARGDLVPALRRAFIAADVMGSDHCPVGVDLEL